MDAESAKQSKEQYFREHTMRPSEVFALRLRDTRQSRGLTQAELAQRLTEDGVPMSKAALLRIEKCERGLSLDEALALTEALQAVFAWMLTPPEGMFVKLNENVARDGSGLREWLHSGLPWRSSQPPPLELVDDVQRDRFQLNLARLALALVDAGRFGDKDSRQDAVRAIVAEVTRREAERATDKEGE